MTIFYRVLQAIVLAALAVLLWFFIVGLGDGSIDDANILLWLALLAVPTAALFGSMYLWTRKRRGAACLVLAIPAAPAILYGLFVALFIVLQPRL